LHIIGGKLVFFAGQLDKFSSVWSIFPHASMINPPLNSRPRLFYDSPHVSFSHLDWITHKFPKSV
jgi:hypothetical protein